MPKQKGKIYVEKLASILLILSVENFYIHHLESKQNFDRARFHHLCCGETLVVSLCIFYRRSCKKQWCFQLC